MSSGAQRFVSSSTADQYVKEIDLPGLAREGRGGEFINSMVSARSAMLRPQFQRIRQSALMGVNNRLGENTDTGQRTRAIDQGEVQIGGQFANTLMQAETANEQIRSAAEGAYLGHLSFMDSMKMQAQIAEDQLNEQRKARQFGVGDALSLAALIV